MSLSWGLEEDEDDKLPCLICGGTENKCSPQPCNKGLSLRLPQYRQGTTCEESLRVMGEVIKRAMKLTD